MISESSVYPSFDFGIGGGGGECIKQIWLQRGHPWLRRGFGERGLGLADNLKGIYHLGFLLIYWTVLSLPCFCAGFLELWRAAATLRLVCGLLIVVASLVVEHRL